MSLQKIGKYTEIFESSRKLQRPTNVDSRRVAIIQNIAIAGLIDSGAPYECENGEIIIDTGIDYKSVFMSDVYPYLSQEGQTAVIIKNSQKAELPPPGYYNHPQQQAYLQPQSYQQQPVYSQPQNDYIQPQTPPATPYSGTPAPDDMEFQPYQNISVQPVPDNIPSAPPQTPPEQKLDQNYQTQASKNAEKKADPIKAMMDGLEDYSNESQDVVPEITTPEDDEMEALFNQNLRQKQAENRKWQDASEIPPVQKSTPAEELKYTPPVNNQPQPVIDQAEAIKKADEPTTVLVNGNEIPAEVPVQPEEDVVEMKKQDITYERCNIEITNKHTGTAYRFSVHAAPINGFDDENIIVRIKLLGKDSNYIQTNYGRTVDFAIERTIIAVSREKRSDGIFSCQFNVTDEYSISKLNIERGGNKGNLVIYDENLELRIYPLPNVKDKNTGKMVFGNNKYDEAAYLYYIKNDKQTIASSGVERKPTFKYNNCNLIIKAKWFGNDIRLSADEYTGE